MNDIRYNSSIRSTAIDEFLPRARAWAEAVGITRVTDVTWLDRIGLPVFVSVRPTAHELSLCVNAGKGYTPEEALVGAIMEGVEFALAEPGMSTEIETCWAPAGELLRGDPHALIDLCPRVGASLDLSEKIFCAQARDLVTGDEILIPAELVFMPAPPESLGSIKFGSNTNGLASGTAREEAIVHAIAEVIERDIRSFQRIRDTSVAVELTTVPGEVWRIMAPILDAGLELFLFYQPNEFELGYFEAVIAEPAERHPAYLNAGYGCHPDTAIAAVRAIAEAVQTRAQMIHGGRDDFDDYYRTFDGIDEARLADISQHYLSSLQQRYPGVPYSTLPGADESVDSVKESKQVLLRALSRRGMKTVAVLWYTAETADVHVCRVIIPKCELFFEHKTGRVGSRLAAYASTIQKEAE